jgi:hypothetical protein
MLPFMHLLIALSRSPYLLQCDVSSIVAQFLRLHEYGIAAVCAVMVTEPQKRAKQLSEIIVKSGGFAVVLNELDEISLPICDKVFIQKLSVFSSHLLLASMIGQIGDL